MTPGHRKVAEREFKRLDAISRERALTNAESEMLERAMIAMEDRPTAGQTWGDSQTARFFEMIANGASIGSAGTAVGKSRSAAQGRFARERRRIGGQAE